MPHRQTDTISFSAKEMVAFLLSRGMSREALLRALAELAPEKTKTSDTFFPSLALAAELIPKYEYTDEHGNRRKWEVVEDVVPSEFKISDLKFLPFLKKGESFVTGKTMRQRAVAMKSNLGLADAKRLLAEQEKIPRKLRSHYIVFPGTVVRDPYGYLHVACLCWLGVRWCLSWHWLGSDWRDRGRLACSESR